MFVETRETPNPLSLQFVPVPEQLFAPDGKGWDCDHIEEATASPLALELFQIDGVERVFLGRDFVSVTKAPDASWEILKPLILSTLVDFLVAGLAIFKEGTGVVSATDLSDLDPISEEIKEILDSRVRPAVARDGGDIIFDRFEDGVVYVQLRGACSGCPSSTATLKSGIESMLRHYVPEVAEVRASADF